MWSPVVADLLHCKCTVRHDRSGAHKVLGSCKLCVEDMMNKAGSDKVFNLSDGAGELSLDSCKLIPQPR